MKNLVSRNPVLRFKLGRKIIKALGGDNTETWGIYPGIPNSEIELQYLKYWPDDTYVIGGLFKDPYNGNIYSTRIKNNGDLQLVAEAKLKEKEFSFPSNLGHIIKEELSEKNKNNKKKNRGKNIKPVNNIWIKGYNRRPEITDVRATQLKLWDLGLLKGSKFGVDGKWGGDTEAAYLKYLLMKSIPTFTPEPVSSPEFKPLDAITPEVKEKIAMDGYTPNVVEQKVVSAPVTYNKSMTRDWLRNNIGTAYGVSGLTRRATKNALNRQLADGDLELIALNQKLYDALKALGLFKKGGQLPSRNPVKRFKLLRKGL